MKKLFFFIIAVFFAVYIFSVISFLGNGSFQLLRISLYLLPPFLSVVGGVYAIKTFGLVGLRAKIIILLTLGIIFWFLGEVVWNWFVLIGISPFPSIADAFYFLAYPFLFFGLLYEFKLGDVTLKRINKSLLILLTAVGTLLGVIVIYFGVFLTYDPQVSILKNVFSMGYGIADLILVLLSTFLVVIIREYKGGKLAIPWLYFLVGLGLTLVPDIIFAMFNNMYDVNLGLTLVMDIMWLLSYIFFSVTFFLFVKNIEDIHSKLKINQQPSDLETK
jgi:hypothetical protein